MGVSTACHLPKGCFNRKPPDRFVDLGTVPINYEKAKKMMKMPQIPSSPASKRRLLYAWGTLLLLTLVLAGCQSSPQAISPEPAESMPAIEKLAVLPFQNMTHIYGELTSVRCGLCGSVFETGSVSEEGPSVMTDQVTAYLKEHHRQLSVINARQAQGELGHIMAAEQKSNQKELDMVLELGRRLGADAVLAGHLFRYTDRIGTNLGVERPASVAFDIDLVHVATGRLIWTARFQETQQSLLENVFAFRSFFRRGGRWLTAAQLSQAGLEQVMDDFPLQP